MRHVRTCQSTAVMKTVASARAQAHTTRSARCRRASSTVVSAVNASMICCAGRLPATATDGLDTFFFVRCKLATWPLIACVAGVIFLIINESKWASLSDFACADTVIKTHTHRHSVINFVSITHSSHLSIRNTSRKRAHTYNSFTSQSHGERVSR